MITMNNILAAVSMATNFRPDEIASVSQKHDVSRARDIVIYLGNRLTQLTTGEIASAVIRERSSVTYAINRLKEAMSNDPSLRALVDDIEHSIMFRIAHREYRNTDVLAIARKVAARPYRNAMDLSVVDISALAESFLVLWEVGQAAHRLAHLTCEFRAPDDQQITRQVNAIRNSICGTIEQMNPPS